MLPLDDSSGISLIVLLPFYIHTRESDDNSAFMFTPVELKDRKTMWMTRIVGIRYACVCSFSFQRDKTRNKSTNLWFDFDGTFLQASDGWSDLALAKPIVTLRSLAIL